MGKVRRKNLTTEHETRFPLVERAKAELGADFARGKLIYVTLTFRGADHRYLVELDPEDCRRVRDWINEQLEKDA